MTIFSLYFIKVSFSPELRLPLRCLASAGAARGLSLKWFSASLFISGLAANWVVTSMRVVEDLGAWRLHKAAVVDSSAGIPLLGDGKSFPVELSACLSREYSSAFWGIF